MVWELDSTDYVLDDGNWHFTAVVVNFPYIGIFIDGREFLPDFSQSRTASGVQTQFFQSTLAFKLDDANGPLYIGARFDSSVGVNVLFEGQIGGAAIVFGPTGFTTGQKVAEAVALSSCMAACPETLAVNAAAVPTPAMTVSYSAVLRKLTLTGAASVAAYETALRAVEYDTPVNTRGFAPRNVEFVINDGVFQSLDKTVAVTFPSARRRDAGVTDSVQGDEGTEVTIQRLPVVIRANVSVVAHKEGADDEPEVIATPVDFEVMGTKKKSSESSEKATRGPGVGVLVAGCAAVLLAFAGLLAVMWRRRSGMLREARSWHREEDEE